MWIEIPDEDVSRFIDLLNGLKTACGLSKRFMNRKNEKDKADLMVNGLGELSTIFIKAEKGRFCAYCRNEMNYYKGMREEHG